MSYSPTGFRNRELKVLTVVKLEYPAEGTINILNQNAKAGGYKGPKALSKSKVPGSLKHGSGVLNKKYADKDGRDI